MNRRAKNIAMPRFELGTLVCTRGIEEKAADEAFVDFVREAVERHSNGDWGEVCEEDKQTNEAALECGMRLLSAYTYTDGTEVWVITEADRSVTTVLFPDEY